MTAGSSIKVLIVDDHEMVRAGLMTLLDKQRDIEVVGEAGTGDEGVRMTRKLKPDVVLMDVRLPDESGVEACRRIRDQGGHTRVVMLTSFSDEEAIFASVLAGASAYLLKRIDSDKLCEAIRAVAKGESIIDPSISNRIVARIKSIGNGAPSRGFDLLTDRERQIIELIADGMTNKEIAEKVNLSNKTVRNYVSSILQKLGVTSRTRAAIYYLERQSSGREKEDSSEPDMNSSSK